MRKNIKIALLASSILVGGISVTSLTSCGDTQTVSTVDTYEMVKDDAIDIPTFLESKGILVNEGTLYSSENRKVAKITGSRLFGLAEGTSRIKLVVENTEYYSFDIKVNGYKTYDDVKKVNKNIAISGDLIDFNADRNAIKGHDYTFSYEVKDVTNNDQDIQVVISDKNVIEYEEVNGEHHIYAKNVGDSIFEIINADGITVFKIVIKVRPELLNEGEYLMALNKFDYWGSIGYLDGRWQKDSTKIIFKEDGQGIFSGNDGGTILPNVNFSIEMDTEWNDSEMVGFYVYNFSITGSFNCKYMQLFKSGDQLMLYSALGPSGILLDLYLPKMNK